MSGSPWGNEKITVERVPDESMNRVASPWGNEKITEERVLDDNPNVHLKNAETALRNKEYSEAKKYIGYARSVSNGNPEVEKQCKRVLDALGATEVRRKEWKPLPDKEVLRLIEKYRKDTSHIRKQQSFVLEKIKTALEQKKYDVADNYAYQALSLWPDKKIQSLIKKIQSLIKEIKKEVEAEGQSILLERYKIALELRCAADAVKNGDYANMDERLTALELRCAADAVENGDYAYADEYLNCVLMEEYGQSKEKALGFLKDLKNAKYQDAKKSLLDALSMVKCGQYAEVEKLIQRAVSLSDNPEIGKVAAMASAFLDRERKIGLLLERAEVLISHKQYGDVEKVIRYVMLKGDGQAKGKASELAGRLKEAKMLDMMEQGLLHQAEKESITLSTG